jgi:hypothetical protein
MGVVEVKDRELIKIGLDTNFNLGLTHKLINLI